MTNPRNFNRVGLLTLPLSYNYGGILQMIALYEVLKQEGYEPVLIDKQPRFRTARENILHLLGKLPMQNFRGARSNALATRKHREYYEGIVTQRTAPVWTSRDIEREVRRLGISTVMVGSDQVWRMDYQKDAQELNYFLNFGNSELRRVSYAASFGHGNWTFPERTSEIRECISKFDAISVRESSGQDICSDILLRQDAKLVLDPTLLLDKDYYYSLIPKKRNPSGVLAYVLDRQEESQMLAHEIAKQRGNLPVKILSPSARNFVSIPDWISEFANADFVVTNSFHGTVFSILFNKPFVTILNSRRGIDRFTTLFETFGLSDRGLESWKNGIPSAVFQEPDFNRAAIILEDMREKSRLFIRNALSGAT